MGLTLQYGISRIMNLAYGETIIIAAFCAYLLVSQLGINPVLGLIIILPGAFAFGYLVYGLMMQPLVKRSAKSGTLEVDSILATFGLLLCCRASCWLSSVPTTPATAISISAFRSLAPPLVPTVYWPSCWRW